MTLAICVLAVSAASAQVVKGAEAQTKRGPYETNRLFDNIFIGVAGGVNYYQGEEDRRMNFEDRLAPAVQAYIGKWITPCVGLRIGYYGYQANGYTTDPGAPYVHGTYGAGYKEKMMLDQGRIDIMWNISNAISGYRADRFWDIAPYIGGGVARIGRDHHRHNRTHSLEAGIGIYNMFRISKSLDITLDVNQVYLKQLADGAILSGKSRQEYIASASIGLAYNFAKRDFSRAHAAVDVTPYNNRIKELEDALAAEKNKPAKVETITKEVIVKGENTTTYAPVAVFFPLGKSTLSATQEMNLKMFVEKAKAEGKNITVTGSADSATGSAKTNSKLAEARMNTVYNLLVKKYGYDASKITKKSIGGTDKYGKPISLNRCVVVE